MRNLIYKQKGFTLVELLVVVGIMAIVGTMTANLFLSNLRTAAKTKALTEVKQNGDYALEVMRRMIRNAREIKSSCPGSGTSLMILNPDENTTTFDCSGAQIASNTATFLTSGKLEVKSGSCSFVCEKPLSKPAVVTITFTLKKGEASLGKEFTAEIPFQTTVSTRTY